MQNITFLCPNTLQFTYQKDYLQGKEICFLEKIDEDNIAPAEITFSEKYLSGFSNILSLIATGDIIYFTLPPAFNSNSTIQFVYDLLAACKYNTPSFVVFDKSRCTAEDVMCSEKIALCNYIQKMFEDSGLPMLNFNSLAVSNPNFNEDDAACSIVYQNFKNIDVNLFWLKKVSTQIHQVFDIKSALTAPKSTRVPSYAYDFRQKNKLKCLYTMN